MRFFDSYWFNVVFIVWSLVFGALAYSQRVWWAVAVHAVALCVQTWILGIKMERRGW